MCARWGLLVWMLTLSGQLFAANVVENEMIVRLENGVRIEQFEVSVLDMDGEPTMDVIEPLVPELNLYLVKVRTGQSSRMAMTTLSENKLVKYAQPNQIVTRRVAPVDPMFNIQWPLSNPSNGADIKALEAWKVGTGGKDKDGNDIVVAVVDGGIDILHQDLNANIWTNVGEIPGNGLDDDGNGYADDVFGWNAFNDNGNITRDYHATHVAGIIGAEGNNNKDVVGVNWNVKIMSVVGASGNTATVAKAYGYVAAQKKLFLESRGQKGANVVATNSSFGVDFGDCNSPLFKAWNDLYNYMGSLGILSAAATANLEIDVDTKGDVPTGCSSPYIISVTNTTNMDIKNFGAGFGRVTIDLGAPGTEVLSTLPGNQTGKLTGTSMATPHVAGAIALMHSIAPQTFSAATKTMPGRTALAIKDLIMRTVDVIPALRDITVSGGRLNLAKSARAMANFSFKKQKK